MSEGFVCANGSSSRGLSAALQKPSTIFVNLPASAVCIGLQVRPGGVAAGEVGSPKYTKHWQLTVGQAHHRTVLSV